MDSLVDLNKFLPTIRVNYPALADLIGSRGPTLLEA